MSKHSSVGWTFTSIWEPMNGSHPVSGNREFGFTRALGGGHTFYSKGVDRLTDKIGENLERMSRDSKNSGVPFQKSDKLWKSFQDNIVDFVNTHGGQANKGTPQIYRPDWKVVKDGVNGKRPISDLNPDC